MRVACSLGVYEADEGMPYLIGLLRCRHNKIAYVTEQMRFQNGGYYE